MLKYCKIINEETGLVQIGVGCSYEYYIEIKNGTCSAWGWLF